MLPISAKRIRDPVGHGVRTNDVQRQEGGRHPERRQQKRGEKLGAGMEEMNRRDMQGLFCFMGKGKAWGGGPCFVGNNRFKSAKTTTK